MGNKIQNNKKRIKKKKFRDLQHNFKPIECMNKTLEHFIITTHKKCHLFLKFLNAMTLKPLPEIIVFTFWTHVSVLTHTILYID